MLLTKVSIEKNLQLFSNSKWLFLVSAAYSSLSSGFEVRAVTVDKNPLKKLKTQDEEIFTIQVSLFSFISHLLALTFDSWTRECDVALIYIYFFYEQISPWLGLWQTMGTLRSNDATATKKSLKKWIWVFSVFIAIIPKHLLCQLLANPPEAEFQGTIFKLKNGNKISSLLVYVHHKTRN